MSDGKQPDYGKLTVEALNRAMNNPEFVAKYRTWLMGLKSRTPFEQAELEAILAVQEAPAGQPVNQTTSGQG